MHLQTIFFVLTAAVFCTASAEDLSLWETGGMYFGMPYKQGTIELDYNYWYEDNQPGMSLYGSYACSDNLTLKLEIPAAFTSPIFSGFKATGLFGKQNPSGDRAFSFDVNTEISIGPGWRDLVFYAGGNAARRWGTFALLGRLSGGVEQYAENNAAGITGIGEGEVGPFVYTGAIGMIGAPLMAEYRSSFLSINIGLDWEIYLPFSISLWCVPRYEIRGDSGFSIWAGIAWMRVPQSQVRN